jgi:hypothetical protein
VGILLAAAYNIKEEIKEEMSEAKQGETRRIERALNELEWVPRPCRRVVTQDVEVRPLGEVDALSFSGWALGHVGLHDNQKLRPFRRVHLTGCEFVKLSKVRGPRYPSFWNDDQPHNFLKGVMRNTHSKHLRKTRVLLENFFNFKRTN